MPKGLAVKPAVLWKAAIRALDGSQPNEGTDGRIKRSTRQQRGRTLHHIARPHQMVAPHVVITFDLAPRDAHRGNESSLKNFVLVGQQYTMAQAIGPAIVRSISRKIVG